MTTFNSSLECEFCYKKFSTKSNCNKHKHICKIKKIKEIENKEKTDIIKQKEEEIKQKDYELKQKDDQITILKSMLETYTNKPNIINYNNNTINNLTIKQMVTKLDPIDFKTIKEHMNNYSTSYQDKGAKGYAEFLCEHPFKDKFITTDFTRNTIVYKTKEIDFIRDPESSYLITRSIKENSNEIIEKASDRLKKINTKIKRTDYEDDFDEYICKKSDIKQLIDVVENISTKHLIDKDVSNIFKNNGLKTYQTLLENGCDSLENRND
jgi:hypothetical protein